MGVKPMPIIRPELVSIRTNDNGRRGLVLPRHVTANEWDVTLDVLADRAESSRRNSYESCSR